MPESKTETARVRKVNFHGGSADVRRARKVHHCTVRSGYPYPCVERIPAGQEYVRVVLFPNHDVATRDVPVIYDVCWQCAPNDLYLMKLDVEIPRCPPGPKAGGDSDD